MNSKKIAVIGGGTGLSTMLKGLRCRTKDITAIVSVADNGGSSGQLRREYGMLPPGDIRNCISALATISPELDDFLNYRFRDGFLEGHVMGNIILAALNDTYNNDFGRAVSAMCDIFNADGRVIPVSEEDITLEAELDSGRVIVGESQIGEPRRDGSRIIRLSTRPQSPKANTGAVEAISRADIVVLGPGSLYTSIIPNLLVDGIPEALRASKAKKIYVCNIMTEPGETDDYSAYDHLAAVERYLGENVIDFVLANTEVIPEMLAKRYADEHAYPVELDEARFADSAAMLIKGNMVISKNDYIRHNFSRLARAIMMIGSL